jgi:hypothetical protein
MAKGANKTAEGGSDYIGPFYPFGATIDAYNLRGLKPREWNADERAYWIGVEPKIAAWYGDAPQAEEVVHQPVVTKPLPQGNAEDANKDKE